MTTSEIEGEKLNRDSVRSSVAKHLGLSTFGLPIPSRSIDGLVNVLIDATTHYKSPLTADRLKSWQASLFPTGYSAGPLGKEMQQFLDWWEPQRHIEDGLLRAGIAHFYFVTIHPFEDGNGRLARALTDMALAQDEKLPTRFYSLSSQIIKERDQYYQVLEKCQRGNCDITEWLIWFLACYTRAIAGATILIADILAKSSFWQYFSQISVNERQRKVINLLLDAGKGKFRGGLTTRKYVSIAKVSRTTAFREISDLLNKMILIQNPSQGRSISYDLNWDFIKPRII